MSMRFEYGVARIKDLDVRTGPDRNGKIGVARYCWTANRCNRPIVSGRACICVSVSRATFFATSIMPKSSIASARSPPTIAFAGAWSATATARIAYWPSPTRRPRLMPHDDLLDLLQRYQASEIHYSDGVVSSRHTPRLSGTFQVAGDGFENKFILDTPIDGFGRPSVYLSLLRLVCSNGAVGYSPAFRSELSVGKGDDGAAFASNARARRVQQRGRFRRSASASSSRRRGWASVYEVNRLYKLLARLHNRGEIKGKAAVSAHGEDGGADCSRSSLFHAYHEMTGDLTRIYGLANLDALSVNVSARCRRRAACTTCSTSPPKWRRITPPRWATATSRRSSATSSAASTTSKAPSISSATGAISSSAAIKPPTRSPT